MIKKLLPWLVAAALSLAFLGSARPPAPREGFEVDAVMRLPVLEGGRVKPLETVARNAMLSLHGKQVLRYEGGLLKPEAWLLDLLFHPAKADEKPVFVIDDPDVLGLFGFPQKGGRYYSFERLDPRLGELHKQAQAAEAVPPAQRSRFQRATLQLFSKVYFYQQLKNTIQIEHSEGLATELTSLQDKEAKGRQMVLAQVALFRPLPPLPGQPAEAWSSVGEALIAASGNGTPHPGLHPLAELAAAWKSGDASAFNAAAAKARQLPTSAPKDTGLEIRFNRIAPFYAGGWIYVLAFLVVAASWLKGGVQVRRYANALLAAGVLFHTWGWIARVVIQGYAPITNLYSSAVMVGWFMVVLGLVVERVYPRGFGVALGAVSGSLCLLIAHYLGLDGDTMTMMQAVLDSNFWLATHVITIIIGYAGTFLAGLIAIAYSIWKHAVDRPDEGTAKDLVAATYGVICFALFFSFVGTVLGGIWADQSWGRFWGWDPKENGALLIVLWNAIILHARWAGWFREKGLMAAAIFGNIITSLSWFGVNMLGVGLHSYGFMDRALFWLLAFCLSQLALMALALAPNRFWDPPSRV